MHRDSLTENCSEFADDYSSYSGAGSATGLTQQTYNKTLNTAFNASYQGMAYGAGPDMSGMYSAGQGMDIDSSLAMSCDPFENDSSHMDLDFSSRSTKGKDSYLGDGSMSAANYAAPQSNANYMNDYVCSSVPCHP